MDDGSGDGKSQVRAAHPATAGLIDTVEALKDLGEICRVDAYTAVDVRSTDGKIKTCSQPSRNTRRPFSLDGENNYRVPSTGIDTRPEHQDDGYFFS